MDVMLKVPDRRADMESVHEPFELTAIANVGLVRLIRRLRGHAG
jgi:hypothetical protein